VTSTASVEKGKAKALSHIRVCDLTGLLASAGATRFLAAFGAQVIRVEQPAHEKHRWDFSAAARGRTGKSTSISAAISTITMSRSSASRLISKALNARNSITADCRFP
jgi:crotonobetainyl-CoA:carnitine CoA-transferase CaiB-like acyl-CoA transferase